MVKQPIALVLKKKNRERLENWLHDRMHEWLEDEDYKHFIITDGFPGVNNYTDEELIIEFKEWVYQQREQRLSVQI